MQVIHHRGMLADDVRMCRYADAIAEVVRPDDVVLDIGTGSGILALLCWKKGARRVYAVEAGSIIEDAERLAKHNGAGESIQFVRGLSSLIDLPEKVDVIVSEILGTFGLQERVLEYVSDAKQRFLKPEGRLIPSRLELCLVPVQADEAWNDITATWRRDLYGVDFSPIREHATSRTYVMDCSKHTLLARPARIAEWDFYEVSKAADVFSFSATFTTENNGPLNGLVGFFTASLSEDNELTNSPEAPLTSWYQMFFPLADPVGVRQGDTVICRLNLKPYGPDGYWNWSVKVVRDGIEQTRQQRTQWPESLGRETISLSRHNSIPRLSAKGRIRKRIMELCDGKRTISDIAGMVAQEFPMFPGMPDQAFAITVGFLEKNVEP